MATGGENYSDSVGSEDLYDVVCDPCQENGELHNAVGMCIDCQDYLCQNCFNVHKISGASRKHELLDKDAMLQIQRSHVPRTKDTCIEKCAVHEDKVVEYYCFKHSHLGCSACITLNHRSCDSVRYIPHVAKDLANNEEYQQVERHLNSVVEISKKVSDDNKQKTKSLQQDSAKAVKMVQDYRRQMNNALDKIENDLIQQCDSLKSEEIEKLASIAERFHKGLAELNTLLAMKETYQNNKQNCKLYTLLMNTQDKLKLAEDGIKEAEKEQSHINSQIKFFANKETLNTLKIPETLGKLLTFQTASTFWSEERKHPVRQNEQTTSMISETSCDARPEHTQTPVRQNENTTSVKKAEGKRIVKAEQIRDIYVRCKRDKNKCRISGLAVLPNNRLVLADSRNGNVKLVDVKHDQVITYLILSSSPWDVVMVTNSQVAVTLPNDKKVAMANVTATVITVDRTLDMDGQCYGVDYRDDKLAVSFYTPDKVQVLTLQGRVLYNITTDQQGQHLFNTPNFIAINHDNTSLYVSNWYSNTVVNVKFDGTVVGTYTESKLTGLTGLLTDSSGYVYVCDQISHNIHQMTSDCRKVQVLLNGADGVSFLQCISYSESDCRLYVGMFNSNVAKVYKVTLDSK